MHLYLEQNYEWMVGRYQSLGGNDRIPTLMGTCLLLASYLVEGGPTLTATSVHNIPSAVTSSCLESCMGILWFCAKL